MNRFFINLRSLDHPASTNTDAQHFSRFSIANFRVPESLLGNIGQPMDDGARRDDEDADVERDLDSLPIELDTYEGREDSAVNYAGAMAEELADKDRVRATD